MRTKAWPTGWLVSSPVPRLTCRLFGLLVGLLVGILVTAATPLLAFDAPAFDLAGPRIDIHVQRGTRTLPIAEVPSLEPGDRLWLHPDMPEGQSVHYILVIAFLRGATDKPPVDWFHRVETWNRAVREEGIFITVPDGAQQALAFLAPETGGDFSTLRAAVAGRPGAFVRSSQDLIQASWDRLRLDAYLAQVKADSTGTDSDLKAKTALAARALGMRVDQQCFDKPSEQQAPCLTQHTEGLVLDDTNAQRLVTQLINGSTADMMNQLSYSAMAGGGAYSPYVGAIVDMVRILSTFHSARFQYIPALALPQQDTLHLRLNTPPSFRDPKSVIVVALPPVYPAHESVKHQPELHAPDPVPSFCAQKPGLMLLAEGAPLLYATPLAHDLVLHVEGKGGVASIDVPVVPEPSQGGFKLTRTLPELADTEVTGQLRGMWGFDAWTGPNYHFYTAQPGGWAVRPSDQSALIVGRDDQLHLVGPNTLCVESVESVTNLGNGAAAAAAGAAQTDPALKGDESANPSAHSLLWKVAKAGDLEITVPLHQFAPGPITIAIRQFGLEHPEQITLEAYAEAASLDQLTLSAGDRLARLKGNRLDEVESVSLGGIGFAPGRLRRVGEFDELALTATGSTATLVPGTDYQARVMLRDGRERHVPASVSVARPQVDLLSKGAQQAEGDAPPPVHLGSDQDLPLSGRLVFFLRSRVPENFPRTEKIEITASDGSFATTLSLADGSLLLEDAHTAVAVIDPLARFGASAFGPLQLRAISADGVTGDWVPLGTLVRIPGFHELHCPRTLARPCTLSGSNLFLATAVATTSDMANAQAIAPDFTGTTLMLPNGPHPGGVASYYLRLRDDEESVQTLTLPVMPMPGSQQPGTTQPSTTSLGTAAEAAAGGKNTMGAEQPISQATKDQAGKDQTEKDQPATPPATQPSNPPAAPPATGPAPSTAPQNQ